MNRLWMWSVFMLGGLACAALVGAEGGAENSGGAREGRPQRFRSDDPIRVGMVAEDFALVRFEDVDISDPTRAQRAQRVKLSSFRGQKPVLLLLSSYT